MAGRLRADRPDDRRQQRPRGQGPEAAAPKPTAERDRLILSGLETAQRIAKAASKRNRVVPYGELLSGAYLGLIDAAGRFKEGTGTRFTSFASHRIHHAITDSLRDECERPRLQVEDRKEVARARDSFYKRTGRRPTPDELEAECGMAHRKNCPGQRQPVALMLGNATGMDREPLPPDLLDRQRREPGPTERAEKDDWWRAALAGLPRRERMIFTLFYRDGLMMHEVASAVGVSESRVSQLLMETRPRLRRSRPLRTLLAEQGRPGHLNPGRGTNAKIVKKTPCRTTAARAVDS